MVRKAYGAGLYAMAGPGFDPDATLALPTAQIAVMGAEAAVNAVYANKLEQITDEAERAAETGRLRRDYEQDIDILRLASELVVDDVVEPEDLRDELVRRFAAARGRDRTPPRRRHISPESRQVTAARASCRPGAGTFLAAVARRTQEYPQSAPSS